MKPNLIVPGAGKSGTSSLHEYLNLHPDIEMSKVKEPHFFTSNKLYSEGLDFYHKMFLNPKVKYHGESSTAYFSDKVALERIDRDLDDVKFIILLRNPVERTISHYKWLVSRFQEFRGFRKCIKYNMEHSVDHRKPTIYGNYKNYFITSLYGQHIKKMTDRFGQENIHVITTKEFNSDTNNAVNSCFTFLGLDKYKISHKIMSNKTKPLLSNWVSFKWFAGDFLKKGVIDLRYLLYIISPYVGKVDQEDKIWLESLLEEDTKLLNEYYPGIVDRW